VHTHIYICICIRSENYIPLYLYNRRCTANRRSIQFFLNFAPILLQSLRFVFAICINIYEYIHIYIYIYICICKDVNIHSNHSGARFADMRLCLCGVFVLACGIERLHMREFLQVNII